MKAIFTVCSNNYLAKAHVLSISLRKHEPESRFFIFLCDEKDERIDYSALADEVITIRSIEPEFLQLVLKYNIVELNTSVKPRVFEYLMHDRGFDKVIYLDPDIKSYHSLTEVFNELESHSTVLTPHICTPVALDGKTPGENMFNNFGIYNLGFIGLSSKPEVPAFIAWWKNHTYKQCYVDIYNGIFVDQLPINHAHIFFKNVKVITNMGLNMGPWNLHERSLEFKNGEYLVNKNQPLIFYHFSSFKPDNMELPLHFYNRYKFSDRPDLHQIYNEYNEDLRKANDEYYKEFPFYYANEKDAHKREKKKDKWANKAKKFFGKS